MKKETNLIVSITMILLYIFIGFHDTLISKNAMAKTTHSVTFKVSWHHEIQFLGYYVAKERGYYAEEGLNVSIEDVKAANEHVKVPDQVASGKFNFGTGSNAVSIAQNQGKPIVALASIYQFGPHALFARADSGISSLSDIAGHSVAIKSASWSKLIKDLLELEGITMDDIKEVKSGFDMTPFYKGEVDVWAGFITNEVARARLKGLKLITFPFYEYGLTLLGNYIYTSKQFLDIHPDIVIKFLRASLKGWNWAVDNPSKAVDIFVSMFSEKAKDRDFHLASFGSSIPLIRLPGVPIGSIDCIQYNSKIKIDIKLSEDFCTTKYLEAARTGMK